MKAIVLRQFGGPEHLHLEENYPDPRPGPGEVLIEVKACGVCYHDLIARRGSLGGIPPMILGHDAVGTVAELGTGVTTFAVGDRAATLQRMNCGACALCTQGRISLCKVDRRFFGEEIAGGYATMMTAPVLGLVHVPTALPWADAAVVSCTTGTAVHVCKTRGRIKDGETVLITGASGGVGLQAVRLCKLLGATVIAITSSPEKVPVLEAAGASHVIVARNLDFTRDVKRITKGEGVDVALEIVGSACFEHTMKCIAPGGRRRGRVRLRPPREGPHPLGRQRRPPVHRGRACPHAPGEPRDHGSRGADPRLKGRRSMHRHRSAPGQDPGEDGGVAGASSAGVLSSVSFSIMSSRMSASERASSHVV